MRDRSRMPCARRAFTLVELLVVVAIIAVLVSLGAWGVFATIGVRQQNNTKGTILVVHKLLQNRWAQVVADAKKETPSPAVVALAGGTSLDPNGARARVIWAKVRLAEAFPQSYAELHPTNPTIVNNYIPVNRRKPHFAKYQTQLAPLTAGLPGESSACLLLALKTLGSDGVSVQEQLAYAVALNDNPNYVGGIPANQIPCLIDSWGNPLAYVRFPWNNSELQASNPAATAANMVNADPIDVNGMLLNKFWYNWAPAGSPPTPRQVYEAQFHSIGPAPLAAGLGPPRAFYVNSVVVSAGKDGVLALGADLSAAGPGAGDNIFSFQLRGD